MQTFFPYPDIRKSLSVLDYRRCGKQRSESFQILKCLLFNQKGWSNHPAVLMWKGYEPFLFQYLKMNCEEWSSRGYKNIKSLENIKIIEKILKDRPIIKPPWLNDEFCKRHKSNLLRKNKEFYSKYNWDVPDNLNYFWPKENKNEEK